MEVDRLPLRRVRYYVEPYHVPEEPWDVGTTCLPVPEVHRQESVEYVHVPHHVTSVRHFPVVENGD